MAEAEVQHTQYTRAIKYSTKHAPTIKTFQADTTFITAIMGPFGSGKSSGCLFKIIKLASLQAPDPDGIRRVRWAVIRNSYPQLKDTTIRTVMDWLPPALFGGYNMQDHNYKIDGIQGLEIELMFRALDRPDQVRNLLSLEVTGAWLNEYREIDKAIFESIQGRTGRYPSKRDGIGCSWHGVIMDSNPPEEGSFYHKLFEEERPSNAVLYKQPSGLSPDAENLPYLPEGYYKNLMIGKDKEFVKVYVEGKYGYIQDGEPITPEYQEDMHRSRDNLVPMRGSRCIRFWDGGHNPSCVICQVHPVTGRLHLLDCWVGENIGMIQLIRSFVKPAVRDKYSFIEEWFDTGDPSLDTSDDSNTDISPANVINAELNANFVGGVMDWDTRRSAIKYVLTNQPMLLISNHVINMHEGLRGGWKYKKQSDGQVVTSSPMKNIYSHPCDALSQGLPLILNIDRGTSKPKRTGFRRPTGLQV